MVLAHQSGVFRSDLYYRINVFPIEVAPLDQRREDIPLLAEHFVAQFSRPKGKRIESIDPASMDYLCGREWPGNVRELSHVIERAMILSDGPCLRIEASDRDPARSTSQPPRPPSRSLPPLQAVEAEHIRRALEQTGGVIQGPKGAAAVLGLNPSTLRFRIKRLGIERIQ